MRKSVFQANKIAGGCCVRFAAAVLCTAVSIGTLAQAQANAPDLTGVWAVYRSERGGDPKLAPTDAGPLPLKPEFAKPYAARRAAEAEANKRGEQLANGSALCIPYGVPTMMSVAIYPVEMIQTPRQLTIISEAFSEVRRVYLDRPQAKLEDVPPGYYGRSVGHWEGDTLLVDTIGIKTSVTGYRGMPHSEQMHITERLKLVGPDYLHDQVTIEDPIVLDKPVVYTLAYKRMLGYEMVEFVCDNNREYIDEKGVVRLRLKDR